MSQADYRNSLQYINNFYAKQAGSEENLRESSDVDNDQNPFQTPDVAMDEPDERAHQV